jgi:hypothetical protein
MWLTNAFAVKAEDFSAEELNRRTIERRAVEAVIWGMAVVNTDLMRQEMFRKTTGKENEMLYWSRPADDKNQTLTPNPDCIYFVPFFNTKQAGPIVIELPPADTGSFAGSIMTFWQMPMADVGPEGADQGKGGKYLVLPPGYKEKAPDGYIVLPSDTYAGYCLLRSNLISHSNADIAKAVAYWEAGENLSSFAGAKSARHEVLRRKRRGIRFNDQI